MSNRYNVHNENSGQTQDSAVKESRVREGDDRGRVRMTTSRRRVRRVEFKECLRRLETTYENTIEYHNNYVRKLKIKLNANSKDIRLNK